MAYVGRGIDNISNASLLDVITFTGSAGPYNLTQSSAAFTPVSVQALVISIDGVIQSPSSYTISAATITFDYGQWRRLQRMISSCIMGLV